MNIALLKFDMEQLYAFSRGKDWKRSMKRSKTSIHPYTRELIRGNGGTILLGTVNIILSTAGCLMLARLIKQCIDLNVPVRQHIDSARTIPNFSSDVGSPGCFLPL